MDIACILANLVSVGHTLLCIEVIIIYTLYICFFLFSLNMHNLIASSDQANNIILYDTRGKEVKKLRMNMRVNALAWNPMEAFILTAASEDYK